MRFNQQMLNHFNSIFGEEETRKEIERIEAREATQNAMPRDMEWLLDTIYDHVAWHEFGVGKRFLHYKEQVERLYSPGMTKEEVEAIRKKIIGY